MLRMTVPSSAIPTPDDAWAASGPGKTSPLKEMLKVITTVAAMSPVSRTGTIRAGLNLREGRPELR